MRCKNCRYEIERDALYCTHCGKYTGRHPRTQNPVFLKRVIAWLLLIVALLLIACTILGVLAANSFKPQPPRENDVLPATEQTDAPSALPSPSPTAEARGEEVTSDYTVSDKKKLNMMLSAFSLAGVDMFSQEGGDADTETMLDCAFLYCKRNQKSAVTTTGDRQHLSADLMQQTCKQLFGIKPEKESVGAFSYENNRFYTSSSKKPDTMFAQLTAIYKNSDGTYTIDMDIYDYGDEAFSSEFYTPKSRWSEEFDVKRTAQATAVMRDLDSESNRVILSYEQKNI